MFALIAQAQNLQEKLQTLKYCAGEAAQKEAKLSAGCRI
jgi:hypothetical protein